MDISSLYALIGRIMAILSYTKSLDILQQQNHKMS